MELSMSTQRIDVTNLEAWGKLVKSWATGRDYVRALPAGKVLPDEPAAGAAVAFPKPTSFKELVQVCIANNVGMYLVATATEPKKFCDGTESIGLALVQGAANTFVLRLPAKDNVHAAESALLGGAGVAPLNYALPDFYAAAFGVPNILPAMEPAAKMKFHALRVGEYTMNSCA
jgi:hypothetical protein